MNKYCTFIFVSVLSFGIKVQTVVETVLSGTLGDIILKIEVDEDNNEYDNARIEIKQDRSSAIERMRVDENDNVGIGTTTPDSKLTVAGKVHAQEVKVTVNAGADFVFNEDYKLPPLKDVEQFIKENKHLPEIASEKHMQANGLLLAEMNIKLLHKIEELTLYTINQEKKITSQETQLKTQAKINQELKNRLLRLEQLMQNQKPKTNNQQQ